MATILAEIDEIINLMEALIPANPQDPKNKKLTRVLQRSLAEYFRKLERAFPYKKLAAIYNRNVKETVGGDTRAFLDPLLAAFTDDLSVRLNGFVATAYLKGTVEMVEWGKTKAGVPIAFEGPPMEKAVQFAKKHGAKLVTEMDIETKRRLADVISMGIENKRGIPGLARDIKGTFEDMTRFRSDMIARTETANALEQAFLDTAKDMGIGGKEWITSGSEFSQNDECGENEAEGIVPLDHVFGSGHEAPPAHPNCECALAPARLPK